jgi:hypothetical protein
MRMVGRGKGRDGAEQRLYVSAQTHLRRSVCTAHCAEVDQIHVSDSGRIAASESLIKSSENYLLCYLLPDVSNV